ncbi:MAG: hypothetical protein COX62_04090 [Deltaproteobacteria bacterium CG_4_10_14_0_2_um_filter_43_8]|nr:MAG: hypothetical protein COX62_04090 [Deltaproteobacteria bacterium CG_4_10_14_0_2_um_filter_43_8]
MKLTKYLLIFFILFLPIIFSSTAIFSSQFKVTTHDILEIWEHSCINHLNSGNIKKAKQVLRVMNWQCDNKKYLDLSDKESFELAKAQLEEARESRNRYMRDEKTWLCHNRRFYSQIKSKFIEELGKQVFNVLKSIGVNEKTAYIVVSQIALETSWGKRIFGNNIFNIKGKYKGESVDFTTHEQLKDGSWIKITDSFRSYPTVADSITDYLQILKEKWPNSHKALFSSPPDAVDIFISGLRTGQAGGYATDQSYKQKILSINDQMEELLSVSSFFPTY